MTEQEDRVLLCTLYQYLRIPILMRNVDSDKMWSNYLIPKIKIKMLGLCTDETHFSQLVLDHHITRPNHTHRITARLSRLWCKFSEVDEGLTMHCTIQRRQSANASVRRTHKTIFQHSHCSICQHKLHILVDGANVTQVPSKVLLWRDNCPAFTA